MLPLSDTPRLFHLFALVLLLSSGFSEASAGEVDPVALEHFEKRIRPLLVENCIECHGPKKQKGGLRLDSRDGWEIGGDSGPALVPGNLDESRLIHAVRYQDADFQMPPKRKLSPESIAALEEWIVLGAPDPRTGNVAHRERNGIDIEAGRKFWSFQPIKEPKLPDALDQDWPRGAIDRFIRAKQESLDLKPSADASRVDLARRLYFTVIGLPPTPEQIDAFLEDDRPDATERLIDSLLASPHYGERWGRHWLDLARFAESSGGGRTLLFKDAWRYRDYVIESFNNDAPFDQMIREQIAGDLLPYDSPRQRSRQITATAFLALGPTNYELQDKQLLRYDVIDEQIDTIGKAFMGMTLGCARCHDHKFDPIPTSDYYALAGIFKSTRTLFNYTDNVARWVDTPLPLEGEAAKIIRQTEEAAQRLTSQLDTKKAALKLLSPPAKAPPSPGKPANPASFPGVVMDDSSAQMEGAWQFSQYSQNYLGEGYWHDGNERKGESSITFQFQIPTTGRYRISLAYAEAKNRSTRTPIVVSHGTNESHLHVNQQEAPSEHGRFYPLGEFSLEEGELSRIRISNQKTDGYVVVDGVQWQLVEEANASENPERKETVAALKAQIKELSGDLKPLSDQLKSRPLAMSVKEDPEPSDSAIRIRGIESRKGNVVPRGFLQVATFEGAPIIPEDASGRLELANWLAHEKNPLTARILANRVWAWLFGTGIAPSVDNMGTTGTPPTHPELLDYLASRLHSNGWSIKMLVKEILLSRSWQLSTSPTQVATSIDPNNQFLTYYPLRRLDAEQLRDAILSVNGSLDPTLYGPNIDGAGEIDANSTKAQLVEYNYVFKDKRRSVYTPAFRVRRHELFELFDFGNINFTIGKRNVSTVALQALYMLNNPFVIEQSQIAAERMLDEVQDPDLRIDYAFRLALGRAPTGGERSLVANYIQNGQSADSVDNWAEVFQSLFGSVDFRYLN